MIITLRSFQVKGGIEPPFQDLQSYTLAFMLLNPCPSPFDLTFGENVFSDLFLVAWYFFFLVCDIGVDLFSQSEKRPTPK